MPSSSSVILQIYLGALVSGLRAGLIYNTWPLIDGSLVPEGSRLLQFDHRMVAYALELLVLLHAIDVARTLRGGPALTTALALASAVTLQAALGIATLLHQAPLALALPHQAVALVVLAIALVHAERLARVPARVSEATADTPMRHGEQAT